MNMLLFNRFTFLCFNCFHCLCIIYLACGLQYLMKKAPTETQTPLAGKVSSKAEPKNFVPQQTHFPGGGGGRTAKIKSAGDGHSLPSPTDPVWWRSMHAISSYRGNRPTHTHRQTHTHTNTRTNEQTHRQDQYNTLRR